MDANTAKLTRRWDDVEYCINGAVYGHYENCRTAQTKLHEVLLTAYCANVV